jgi:hypothetical protein
VGRNAAAELQKSPQPVDSLIGPRFDAHKIVRRPSPPASPPDHASTFPSHADLEAPPRLPPTTVARLEYPDSPSP